MFQFSNISSVGGLREEGEGEGEGEGRRERGLTKLDKGELNINEAMNITGPPYLYASMSLLSPAIAVCTVMVSGPLISFEGGVIAKTVHTIFIYS